jgi:hypothetical protein
VPTESAADLFDRIRLRGQPQAHPEAIVASGRARFTVLTPRLLRLEWSETGQFEDRGTYAFPTRHADPPPFTTRADGNVLTLDTGALTLRYHPNSGPFDAGNLSIAFDLDGQRRTWTPGTPDPANLRGTRRTLDGCPGDAALDPGLLSRAGWSLFDDSRSVVFDDGWPMPRPDHALHPTSELKADPPSRHPGDSPRPSGWTVVQPKRSWIYQDWYFFGYGHDYKAALADYTRFGGQVPLIPRYVLGAWWSRYWAYSAQDLMDLVRDFEAHDLPLDVLVVDMDWHTPDSWTGYTWNRELFPDPPAFLRWVHEQGLRVTLNLHPAQGVQAFEEIYPRFAKALGVDPASGEPVPFRIADRRFVEAYFHLIHHPMEDDGVDFWWMDWQQGEASEMPGLDPLPWINHLHFSDSRRRGQRPMLYSRWGGLGNHRYPIGFSGDTIVGWPALQFQPYLTATAANVLYGWWSHDIGGHMGGPTEPELYARWVQFGALSPTLRLHATKDSRAERRPWAYPDEVYRAAKEAFHWRYRLVPYLYTLARAAHDTGLAPIRPMYYEHPQAAAAYAARYQYYLGEQMIAAPLVSPANPATGLATTDVWLPESDWIEVTTKETFSGPRWLRLIGDLARMPMLVRAGAILPLAEAPDVATTDRLVLSVFPGAEGRFRLYEDDGLTEAYLDGQYEWTEITTRMDDPHTWAVYVAPVEGRCDALPTERSYEIRLEGSRRPEGVAIDGQEVSGWCYDAEAPATIIQVPARDKRRPLTVTAVAANGLSALGEAHNRAVVRADVERLLGEEFPEAANEADLLDAALCSEASGRADAVARLGGPLVRVVEFSTPEEAALQLGRVIVGAPTRPDAPYDLDLTWTLFGAGGTQQRIVRIEGATEALILDAPFAWDGRVRTGRWTADVTLAWQGATLRHSHHSQTLFPTIPTWRVAAYGRTGQPPEDGALDWRLYSQATGDLASVYQPHALILSQVYAEELRGDASLAAYLETTVVSPGEQRAILWFGASGPVEVSLNEQPAAVWPVPEELPLPFAFRDLCVTESLTLRAGQNKLRVHSLAPENRGWWYFGAALTTPDGAFPTDLGYE